MLDHVLTANGFSDKEAKVYLASLALWLAPASSIARKAGLNRVTTYTLLKGLCQRGFATEIPKVDGSYYQVLDPETLATKIQEKATLLEQSIPALLWLSQGYAHSPKVTYYQGIEGIKQVYDDIFVSQKKMSPDDPWLTFFGSYQMSQEVEQYLMHEMVPYRETFPRKTLAIMTHDDRPYDEYATRNHNTVIVPNALFPLSNEVVLYEKSKIAMMLYREDEMSGVIIESSSLFETLQSLFYMIWQAYKKDPV